MRRSPTLPGLRPVVGTLLLAATGFGCAGNRGAIMTPAGPRWLGPADPIAAGRPPAITFDPYQPDGIPRPQGLARFFPGPSVSTPPAARPAAPVDRSPVAAPPTALASRPNPAAESPSTREPAPEVLARNVDAVDATLPIGITLETFSAPDGSADPETRLASRREPSPAEAGSFDLPPVREEGSFVEGPPEIPDLRP